MSLMTELQRIMDLPDPREEAKKKLVGTTMIINGRPMKTMSFFFDDGAIEVDLGNTSTCIKVKTLEVYLPEAGVYKHQDGYHVIITKVPKRQWLKSFHLSYYNVNTVGRDGYNKGANIFDGIFDKKKQDIFVTEEGFIYFWTKKIGYIKDTNTIVCTNKVFKQELIDWSIYGNR